MRDPLADHFFKQFFDNDLISPHVDLHENTTTICAVITTGSLFASVGLAAKHLTGIPLPGPTAIRSLGDNFAFFGVSMLAMALVAAIQWDALSLNPRDTYNLGSLPIRRRAIVRAKLSALLLFVSAFVVLLNLLPTVIYEALLVSKMPIGLTGLLRRAGAHAIASLFASAFGFLSIVGLREVLRAALGGRFARVSMALQALLVLLLISALLLLPSVGFRVWLHPLLPPVWFVGLAETISGGLIADVTGVAIHPRLAAQNDRWIATYHAIAPMLQDTAIIAIWAVGIAIVVAVAAYAWNVRRLPQPPAASNAQGRALAFATTIFGGRHPIARAGFAFALQAIVRSPAHRLSMAAAAALATAMSFIFLRRIDLTATFDPAAPPRSLLAFQTLVLIILIGGFRNAVRRPAELRANWILQIAWRSGNPERQFLAGTKRAAIVGVGLLIVSVLFPFHAWLLGARTALAHAATGLMLAVVLVEAFFAGYPNVPFASSYAPAGNIKIVGPLALIAFFVFLNFFTRLERHALAGDDGIAWLLAALAAVFVVLRAIAWWRQRRAQPLTFSAEPDPVMQWLDLSG